MLPKKMFYPFAVFLFYSIQYQFESLKLSDSFFVIVIFKEFKDTSF